MPLPIAAVSLPARSQCASASLLFAAAAFSHAACGGIAVLQLEDEPGSQGGAGAAPESYVQISSSWDQVCAIDTLGQLRCWGVYVSGADGSGSTFSFAESPRAVDPTHAYRKVSAGVRTTCAIRADGTLWCWGHNQGGALATGDRKPSKDPLPIGDARDWENVAVGSGFVCGLRTGGALYCWGSPDYGAVSDEPLGPEVLKVPTRIDGTWTALGSHWYQTIAVRDDGSLWFSENDGVFEPVDGFVGRARNVAVGVLSAHVVDDGGALFRVVLESFEEAEQTPEAPGVIFGDSLASCYSGCAISADHDLYCASQFPAREDEPLTPFGDGESNWISVGVGQAFGCGSRADGSIWCWGRLGNEDDGYVDYGPVPIRID